MFFLISMDMCSSNYDFNFISYENPAAKNSLQYFVIVYTSKYLLSDLRFTKLDRKIRAGCG